MSRPILHRLSMQQGTRTYYWVHTRRINDLKNKNPTYEAIEPEVVLDYVRALAPKTRMWWQVRLRNRQNPPYRPYVAMYRDWSADFVPEILLPTDEAFDAWLQYARMLYARRR
jgi:hypothetical protein